MDRNAGRAFECAGEGVSRDDSKIVSPKIHLKFCHLSSQRSNRCASSEYHSRGLTEKVISATVAVVLAMVRAPLSHLDMKKVDASDAGLNNVRAGWLADNRESTKGNSININSR